jgi:mannose-6-phosphate isomerase
MIHTNKPWGYEELLEHNEHYVVKRLFMKEGHCCSLQYHKKKHETIYVLSGTLKVIYGDSEDNLHDYFLGAGDVVVIIPFKVHRMCGETDCLYLESSTAQLDDVVRLQDDYGRVN